MVTTRSAVIFIQTPSFALSQFPAVISAPSVLTGRTNAPTDGKRSRCSVVGWRRAAHAAVKKLPLFLTSSDHITMNKKSPIPGLIVALFFTVIVPMHTASKTQNRSCRTRRQPSQIPNADFCMSYSTNIVCYLFNSTTWIMMADKQNNKDKTQLLRMHVKLCSAKANVITIRVKVITKGIQLK